MYIVSKLVPTDMQSKIAQRYCETYARNLYCARSQQAQGEHDKASVHFMKAWHAKNNARKMGVCVVDIR